MHTFSCAFSLTPLILITLLSNTLAYAPRPSSTPASNRVHAQKVLKDAFIIQINPDAPKLHKRAGESTLSNVLRSIKGAGLGFSVRQRFTEAPSLFHGASILVSPGVSAEDLAKVAGVEAVWPVQRYQRPPVVTAPDSSKLYSASPITAAQLESTAAILNSTLVKRGRMVNGVSTDHFGPHTMTGVNTTQAKGYLGSGIKIGILDTGVDYTNPILGGCFGPGCHISFGYDLVGDDYNGANSPIPDADPFSSCAPHGTHVTGIIGALPNGYGFSGVAPAATIGMYRIFGCTGDVTDDVIMAALIRAINDDCKIMTLSLGGPGGWISGTPEEILVDQLAAQGRIVTVAAGNSRDEGLFFSQEPAVSRSGFSVASTDVLDLTGYNATVIGHSPVPILSVTPLDIPGVHPLYFTSTNSTIDNDACHPLPPSTPNLANMIVVIQRGTCFFDEKMANVFAFGAKYVLIFNGATAKTTLPYLETDNTGILNVAGLRRSDGLTLLELYLQGETLSMEFPPGPAVSGIADTISGGLTSSFSNYGPSNDLFGQPTLSAPGGNILSTFPLSVGGLGIISGTSMATPFIAGSIAVLLSARSSENLTPLEVRSILVSTGSLRSAQLSSVVPFANAVVQGGGLVQLDKAVTAKTLLSPNEFLLNDTTYFNGDQTLTLNNRNSHEVRYSFTNVVAECLNTYANPGDILVSLVPPPCSAKASVSFSTRSLYLPAGGTGTVVVAFTPPNLSAPEVVLFPVYSGWVSVLEHGNGLSNLYNLPYFGVAAAMLNMPILDTTDTIYGPGAAYPFLINQNSDIQSQDQTTPYTLGSGGPYLYFRLAAGTLKLSIDVVEANINFAGTVPTHNNGIITPLTRFAIRSLKENLRSSRGFHNLNTSDTTVKSTGRLTYASIPTLGSLIQTESYVSRDYLVGSAADTPFSDSEIRFDGGFFSNGQNVTAVSGSSYRLLLRALKITGDAMYEDQWESWLSPSFTFT